MHVIYAPDVRLPLPPAYQRLHTMGVTEAVSIAAAAEAARSALALPGAARGGSQVIGAPKRLGAAASQHRAARHPPFYAGMPCGTCSELISAVRPGTTSGGQVVHDTLSCLAITARRATGSLSLTDQVALERLSARASTSSQEVLREQLAPIGRWTPSMQQMQQRYAGTPATCSTCDTPSSAPGDAWIHGLRGLTRVKYNPR